MVPEVADFPRRHFDDAQSFLTVARALVEVGAYVWRPKHQIAHSVSEFEAVNLLRFATPRMVAPDLSWEGRWSVKGVSMRGRFIRMAVSVWMSPRGDVVYIASAFGPDDP